MSVWTDQVVNVQQSVIVSNCSTNIIGFRTKSVIMSTKQILCVKTLYLKEKTMMNWLVHTNKVSRRNYSVIDITE